MTFSGIIETKTQNANEQMCSLCRNDTICKCDFPTFHPMAPMANNTKYMFICV